MNAILLHFFPIICYASLSAYFFLQARNPSTLQITKRTTDLLTTIILSSALLVHGLTLLQALFPADGMRFSLGLAISLTVWLSVCFYWIQSCFYPLKGLQIFVMPIATILTLSPIIFPETHTLQSTDTLIFKAHFLVAMSAYSLFSLAVLHGVIMSITEKQLHTSKPNSKLLAPPPLMTMEKLLFRLIYLAFILLTLTVISGIFFSEMLFSKPFKLEHKTLFALISWSIFATLVLGRLLKGWRGKTAIRWILAGFIALMLAYFGSHFVLEIILDRA